MTGVILAGGRNSRMGRNKADLPWKSSDFLHTILEQLSHFCDELIVSANHPVQISGYAVKVVPDLIPACGPLSGIHAALTAASSEFSFVTACDMPYISDLAARHLCSLADGWDIVVPVSGQRPEPLFACYAKTCLPCIETMLVQNQRKTANLFPLVRCRQVPVEELAKFDPGLQLLRNINNPEEYQSALREVEK